MLLSAEKAKAISEYLMADKERAQRLLAMDPKEAAKEMSATVSGITADELIEFGNEMSQAVVGNGELSDSDLDNVSGGLGVVATYAVACGIALLCGYGVGRLEKW
ncbi:MAG: hypothetical protein IJD81_11090 [Oscillospiraceae bacterium]|nr:hypothetical protein [Oscillospiraceae bacterium]